MAKLNWRTIGWLSLTALPMAAAAQFPLNGAPPSEAPAQQENLGGTPAFDLIRLNGLGPGIPLRKGNIIPGSERVQLDNTVLAAGPDYGMDYVAGVVYVKRAIRPGMSLTVFYRYDAKAPAPAPEKVAGISTLRMDLVPGKFNMLMGMGMAERSPDGQVSTSNIFGFNSNFTAGSASLKGIFLYSERSKVDSEGLMGYQGNAAETPAGKSSLILQNLSTKIGKGSFDASYQDVSKNFTNFGSALAAGYDAKVVDQLAKEKGLKRMGFGLNNVQVGSMALNQSYRSVQDGANSIDWRSFGLQQKGFSFDWNSQHVDRGFTRFNDLSEADRAQLQKEAGMDRQNLALGFAQKFGKLDFKQTTIGDGAGSQIERRELALDTSKLKMKFGDQTVGRGFARIGSILPNEQAMYGAELGVHRQWMSLDAALGSSPLHFASMHLSTDNGGFQATDFNTGNKTWSLEHASRNIDSGFTSFGALTASADEHVRAIANMYQKDVALRPEDKGIFLRVPGIDREFTRFTLAPLKGTEIVAQRMQIKTATSSSYVNSFALKGKNISFDYRKQSLGANFDPNALMLFERDRLGVLPGLDRTDMALSMDLGGNRKLSISQTDGNIGEDGFNRQTLKYTDKKIDIEAGVRNVGSGFTNSSQLVDGEKDLLASLRGFNERDVKIKWEILPNLKIDGMMFEASSDDLSQQKLLRNLFVNWKPDKKTELTYLHFENKFDDPSAILFANQIDRFTFFKDFGKLGKVSYLKETQSFDGSQTSQPDSQKQMFAYEAQLDKKTSLRTEQTSTKFDNGDKEDISANTISTAISKQMGVSVSDVKVDRAGSDHDEKKRNYGVWFDFGHGFRFNWGYARQLNGLTGAMQSQTGLSGGTVGNWRVDDAFSNINSWDQDGRTQAATKFGFGTVKPMNLGFLKDVMLNVGLDSASDRARWIKENKVFSFAGKMGSNQIGFDYRSQIAQDGQRGIDRIFLFKTDQSDKRWLRGSVFYKLRTLPNGKQMMIRDMSFTLKPTKQIEITNSMVTNPEQPNGGVLLGTLPSADRRNRWALEYKPKQLGTYQTEYTFGANWDELINDQNQTLTRTAGTTFKVLFGNPKSVKADDSYRSSLQLFYGLEQNNTTQMRRLAQRYSIQYDQRPGPNQIFSFLFGNLSYEHSVADGFRRNNWTARMDYQLRF